MVGFAAADPYMEVFLLSASAVEFRSPYPFALESTIWREPRIRHRMHQSSLLDDELTKPSRAIVGIIGSAPATPAHRKFNQLIERLTEQRQELARWRAFRLIYTQQLAEHYQPAMALLREKQIDMVRLLDHAHDGKALAKHERAKVRDILCDLLSQLLADSPDAELVRLHDKYADRSFADARSIRGYGIWRAAGISAASSAAAAPRSGPPKIGWQEETDHDRN
jgi:hypothetical protein